MYSGRSWILNSTVRKYPSYKLFDYSVKYGAMLRYHHPCVKNYLDNASTHFEKLMHTSLFLLCHNKGMNTTICCFTTPSHTSRWSARLGHKFTPRYVSPVSVSHMDTLSYVHSSRVRSYLNPNCVDKKNRLTQLPALSDAFICWRVGRSKDVHLTNKKRCLSKCAEVIVARQAALWVHYLKHW